MAIVFQYGSNCSEREMNSYDRLRGDARFVDIAETVEDYQLVFDVFSTKRGCAAADIRRTPGERVWGVLYDIPHHLMTRQAARHFERRSFDAIEGEGTNYRREQIQVRKPGGEIVTALTYVVINPQPNLRTSAEYVGHIVAGLRDHGVPEEYIATVKRIATENNPDLHEAISLL
jgi:gamma-glutamylcyclotransferase